MSVNDDFLLGGESAVRHMLLLPDGRSKEVREGTFEPSAMGADFFRVPYPRSCGVYEEIEKHGGLWRRVGYLNGKFACYAVYVPATME